MPVDVEGRRTDDAAWHERLAVAKLARMLGMQDVIPLRGSDDPYPTREQVIAEADRRRTHGA